MANPDTRFLSKMLGRLFASLLSGPSLNCRPHNSRQRIDVTALARLHDIAPEKLLRELLTDRRSAKIAARVPMPKRRSSIRWRDRGFATTPAADAPPSVQLTPDEKAAEEAWLEQQGILNKIRAIVEDARTYEQDTGVHVLHLGFPLLSLPPGSLPGEVDGGSRRILAPIAFVPVKVSLKRGPVPTIEIECRGDGIDLVIPNTALFAWIGRPTGTAHGEVFADEQGQDPWREIRELTHRACEMLSIPTPDLFKEQPTAERDEGSANLVSFPGTPAPAVTSAATTSANEAPIKPFDPLSPLPLLPAPRAGEGDSSSPQVLITAILGLFPVTNQGLLRDLQALVDGEAPSGPIESFIRAGLSLDDDPAAGSTPTVQRLIAAADPCQARSVKLACHTRGLVIHGPPGTGKSQTITNIIGDHLARGQRVLVVCDKRTALDVVYKRLEHLGLGQFCALVHDTQRDQRELYRSIRDQLDQLSDARTDANAPSKLAEIDRELEKIHQQLLEHHRALMARDGSQQSFHERIGQWLALSSNDALKIDE